MKVAVLSGKGGAGKTLVAVNLAATARARYVDADVEEPNGHLFLPSQELTIDPVEVLVPVVDHDRCDACRVCVDFCRFNALALINDRVEVFEQVCTACGGCTVLCPQGAISEKRRLIGHLQTGVSDGVEVRTGVMMPGVVSGVAILSKLFDGLPADDLSIIDGPPGASCLVVETARIADHCVLVAEPTAFGVHNLRLIAKLVAVVGRPAGILVNKALDDDTRVEEVAEELGLPVLGRLPYDPAIAKATSEGRLLARESPVVADVMEGVLARVKAVPACSSC